jgi:hypothetical protein
MPMSDNEPSPMIPWTGPFESVLHGSNDDLLRELLGAMDSVRDGSIKLTKSGIPPKPLWSSLNDRLLWQDPRSVLFDWDEVDQIRFIYSLASELKIIQPDEERVLRAGPGADPFFLASPIRRGRMLARAYVNISDWDERCDARNNQGHRHNFGQTFRRDFRVDVHDVRRALLSALSKLPTGDWYQADTLAILLTEEHPEMLVSEDDDVPPIYPGEPEPEIRRLVNYWVFLAARFGWVDLARTPETEEIGSGQRLVKLNAHGLDVLTSDRDDRHDEFQARMLAQRPFATIPTGEIVVYRHEGDFSDEYLARRVAEDVPVPSWDEPTLTCRVSRQSIQYGVRYGADPDVIRERLLSRARTEVPRTVQQMFDDSLPDDAEVFIQTGYSAVELAAETSAETRQKLIEAGFDIFEMTAIVPSPRWTVFCSLLGGEPDEAFDYPINPDEPLASFDGSKLVMRWPVLPLAHSELLALIGLSGQPLTCTISEETLAHLLRFGWPARAVAEALSTLTSGDLPKRLRSEFKG